MASDGSDPDAAGPDRESLSLSGDDAPRLTRWFAQLAEGGAVDVPLEKQVWGDTFGQVADRYGLRWLVNSGSAPA